METRLANHKTARCITCPLYSKNVNQLCWLHKHIDGIPVEPDYYCDHHPDNEPLRAINEPLC